MPEPTPLPKDARTLRLGEFKRGEAGAQARYVARLSNAKGAESHELVIAGPDAAIERAFADAELAVGIEPNATMREWQGHLQPALEEESRARDEFAALTTISPLFKKKLPTAPTEARSVFVSLRRLEPDGTRYFFRFSNFFVPRFFSFFFALPPVCSTFGIVRPTSGDQDLFLHLGWPPLGPVRASVLGGTSVDVVTLSVFCTPFTHFAPIHQLFGFTAGVCGSYTFGGTDIFG